jgi:hypothetical protein
LNVKVLATENVYPMVPAGGAINEMVLGPVVVSEENAVEVTK